MHVHFLTCVFYIILCNNYYKWSLQVLIVQSVFVEEKVTVMTQLQYAVLSEVCMMLQPEIQTEIRQAFLTVKGTND